MDVGSFGRLSVGVGEEVVADCWDEVGTGFGDCAGGRGGGLLNMGGGFGGVGVSF